MQVFQAQAKLSEVFPGLIETKGGFDVFRNMTHMYVHKYSTRQVLQNEEEGISVRNGDGFEKVNDLVTSSAFTLNPDSIASRWDD